MTSFKTKGRIKFPRIGKTNLENDISRSGKCQGNIMWVTDIGKDMKSQGKV